MAAIFLDAFNKHCEVGALRPYLVRGKRAPSASTLSGIVLLATAHLRAKDDDRSWCTVADVQQLTTTGPCGCYGTYAVVLRDDRPAINTAAIDVASRLTRGVGPFRQFTGPVLFLTLLRTDDCTDMLGPLDESVGVQLPAVAQKAVVNVSDPRTRLWLETCASS